MKLHPNVTNQRTISMFDRLEKDFKAVHGDKYDYSKAVIVDSREPITIVCKKHDTMFQQTITNHRQGKLGCRKCFSPNSLTATEFFLKACTLHVYKYTYKKETFKNLSSTITCKCPEHGEFHIIADNHIRQLQGCKLCSNLERGKVKSKGMDKFIKDATEKFKENCIYCHSEYKNNRSLIKYSCPKHGVQEQTAHTILKSKGCPECSKERQTQADRTSFQEFVLRAEKVHSNLYNYDETKWQSLSHPTMIFCIQCSTTFKQSPAHHVNRGHGCPNCSGGGFNPNLPSIFYVLLVVTDQGSAYKIGITNRSVKERYLAKDLDNITILLEKPFLLGKDALLLETKLKRENQTKRYAGVDLLTDGNTELFTENIYEMSLKEEIV